MFRVLSWFQGLVCSVWRLKCQVGFGSGVRGFEFWTYPEPPKPLN